MTITEDTIYRIADSANLKWKPEEIEGVRRDLERMVCDMEILSEVNTQGIEPLSHICWKENVFREDEVTNSVQKEAMLLNAAETREGYFIVPKSV